MKLIEARFFAVALLVLETCAGVTALAISVWERSFPYRISPAQQTAIHAAGYWLGYVYLTAFAAALGAILLLRSPVCRTGCLRRWATIAGLALVLVFVVEALAPRVHSVSYKPLGDVPSPAVQDSDQKQKGVSHNY